MFVNQNNTSQRADSKYGEVIKEIANHGVCPFCPDSIKKYHKKALVEKKYWWVTDNMYPYLPTKHHCLIIHKIHISHLAEISEEAWTELETICRDESSSRSISGGTFVMRFGDTRYTGASVTHLHAHIIQSDPNDKSYDNKSGLTMRIG